MKDRLDRDLMVILGGGLLLFAVLVLAKAAGLIP